ncbi:hypothetical protein U1Q18_051287, partial [Sarracenia purpurea var. burkii]
MAAEVPLDRPAETTDFSGKNHAASPTDTFRGDRRAWCDSADFVPRGQIIFAGNACSFRRIHQGVVTKPMK